MQHLHLSFVRSSLVLAAACALASPAAQAARFNDLHDFTGSGDGREPSGSLVAWKGLLYGTTNVGGSSDAGCIYALDPASGAVTVLYSFTGAFGGQQDGSAPVGEMIVVGGQLYGATSFGGQFDAGTVFRFDPATGVETVVHDFGSGDDGALPGAGPVAAGTMLYGTTTQGGTAGLGTAYAVDLGSGLETVLHAFAGGDDGASPFAPLAYADGLLYGTTFFGGPSNDGTVFMLDPVAVKTTVLHAFAGPSFSGNPAAGLTIHGGQLYGTTAHGGLQHCDGGCGTVFRVDAASGKEKDVYRFRSPRDGEDPEGGLVLRDGTLYGSTQGGGKSKNGTLFSVDLATGAKTTLHDFKFSRGANPGTLMWYHGILYGTTHGGGGAAEGTAFDDRP